MDKGTIAITMIPVMLAVVMGLGVPFYSAIGGVALIYGLAFWGVSVIPIIAIRVYGFITEAVFIAVPMFVLMGTVFGSSGVAENLFLAIYKFFGPVRGGLTVAVGIICTLMAACTGIAAGPVATMGLIALPIMLRQKYEPGLACGCISACGTLGTIIPPSVLLILYGMNSDVSVGKLYMAAFIPGFVLSGCFLVYFVILGIVKPYDCPAAPPEERATNVGAALKDLAINVVPVMALIFAVLGTIYLGIATATEASGVGALGAVLISIIYRKFTWPTFKRALIACYRTTAMIGGITIGANFFSSVFLKAGGGGATTNLLVGMGLSPIGIMWGCLFLNFLLGFVMNNLSIILILVPIFNPMLTKMGVNPLWFAMLFNLMCQVAYLTPPFAPGVYLLKPLCPPEVELQSMYKGIIPFVILDFMAIFLVYFFPGLATWLPSVLIRQAGGK